MKQIPIQKKVRGSNRHPETVVMEIIGYALVDDKHYVELNQYTWTLDRYGYVRRTKGTGNNKEIIYIHTDIWCRLEGRPRTELDHKDRNPKNNQTDNLRPATRSQSSANIGLLTNSTSGFKGVSWHKRANKYIARIMVNEKSLSLGYFSTTIEAAKAYDAAAIKYFGEFAVTNKTLGLLD